MLNEKQKKAADYFMEIKDEKEALIRAGYGKDTVKKYKAFFEKPQIVEYINKKLNEIPSPSDEIISYLTKVLRGEETDATASQRIKAAEMLSKHYGLDKIKEPDKDNKPIVIYDNI